jgi:hypothetical protein
MTYTLGRTWPDKPDRLDDYVFRYRGVDVGRTYATRLAGNVEAWRRTIYIGIHVKRIVEDVAVSGHARTLAEAKTQFRASFERMIAADVVKIPE